MESSILILARRSNSFLESGVHEQPCETPADAEPEVSIPRRVPDFLLQALTSAIPHRLRESGGHLEGSLLPVASEEDDAWKPLHCDRDPFREVVCPPIR